MNTNETSSSNAAEKTTQVSPEVLRAQKKKSRAEGRKKRTLKLKTDKEFAKQHFAAKSKRSTEKKSAFRKKKSRKK